jgi:N-methylhydantoinase B
VRLSPAGQLAEWVSLPGRARLGPVSGDYRAACAVLTTPLGELAPEFATRPGRPGAAMLLREYLCPVTGRRLATEIIRAGDEPAADMVLEER